MDADKEIVALELSPICRLNLNNQIAMQMELKGYDSSDWTSLKFDFITSNDWPINQNAQPTLAQLIIIAKKLDMRIIISDLLLVPKTALTTKELENGK